MANASPAESSRPRAVLVAKARGLQAISGGLKEAARLDELRGLQQSIRDFGTLRSKVSRGQGGSVGVGQFFPLGFRAQLAGFRIKFPEPYGAGLSLSCKFALEAWFRLGLDAPAGHIMLIKCNAGYFFVLLVEIDR